MNRYDPLLTEKSKKTQSYRIASLFYITLFGGIIALMIMGLNNARMLRLQSSKLWILLFSSIALLIGKYFLIRMAINDFGLPPDRFGLSLFKMPDLLLFAAYYHTLKIPYRLHMIYHNEHADMGDILTIIACTSGIVIDIVTCVRLFN